jgi:hypothetical protein
MVKFIKNSTESNDEDHTLLCGVFSTNDWIKEDFKGFSFQRANNGKSKNEFSCYRYVKNTDY